MPTRTLLATAVLADMARVEHVDLRAGYGVHNCRCSTIRSVALTGQRKCLSHKVCNIEPKRTSQTVRAQLRFGIPGVHRPGRRGAGGEPTPRPPAAGSLPQRWCCRHPHNAISPAEAVAVVELAIGRYQGANHTRLTELLGEREGTDMSRLTVRRILTRAGIGSPRRRQRMPQAGMLI